MTRNSEVVLLLGAAALAAFGVGLVNLAEGDGIDAQVALTFLVFSLAFGGVHLGIRQWANRGSPYLLPLAAALTAIGFVEVYRLDRRLAALQRWWLLVAAALAVVFLFALRRTGVAALRRYRYVLLAGSLLFLLLPMLPSRGPFPLHGLELNGSRLWIRLDVFGLQLHFQPAELTKLVLVVFLASYLAERQAAIRSTGWTVGRFHLPQPRLLIPVLLAWIASLTVLIWQRDLGASLLLFTIVITMLYAATGSRAYVWTGAGLFATGALAGWLIFDHVQRRVTAWLVPFSDFDGAGYQIAQGYFALGSGSISGSGLGLGRPDLIPQAATDFVFAAIGEELGLAGTAAVILLFVLLVGATFGIALRSRDEFRKLLAAGLGVVIGVQALLIIGGVLRALPLTGIALPFMSYGGSSLVANLLILALLARISHEERA
jgi:cell division protein FtsW (lipid II flippase)